ncbi:MAG: sulfotransferase [Pseudomonadota bacterium]
MFKPPIFIGGSGRSGTTLLRVMLDSHPEIYCGPELKLLPSISNLWGHSVREFRPIMDSYLLDRNEVSRLYREFIESFFYAALRESGKSRFAEKSPNNVFCFTQLAEIFPDAVFVQIIRDGRDVVSSLLNMDWKTAGSGQKPAYTSSALEAARYWVACVGAGRKLAIAENTSHRYFEVRYEDLILQPMKSMRSLLTFLGEDWDPRVLSYHSIDRDRGLESSSEAVAQPLSDASIGRWRKDLTESQLIDVHESGRDLLEELDYC